MERELKERLERLGKQILTASRNEIYLSMRFFGSALHRFSYELHLSTQTIGTDGEKLYYNPKYLMEVYDKSSAAINRAYLHVLLHGLFRHLFKAGYEEQREENKKENQDKDYTIWDLACDIAVESIMDSFEGITCVLSNVSFYREEVYQKLNQRLSVLTAEGIYQELKIMTASQKEFDRLKKEFYIDDHSFWRGRERNQKQNKNSLQEKKEQLEKIWEETAKKTQTAMETYYQQEGDRAGNLKKLFRIKNRHADYKHFLKQFAVIKEEIALDLDSFDYIPYCFGMNGYGNGISEKGVPLIEPLEYQERHGIDEFAIAIDTSGSIARHQIENFLSETVQILQSEETFFRKIHIHILQCDVKLQKDFMIKTKEDLQEFINGIEVSGFGGTDFRPVFSYLEELSSNGTFTRLRGLLYFTDGFGTYPEKIPSFETAFILPADRVEEPQVPPWAMKVSAEFYK